MSFADWSEHYSSYDAAAMIAEAMTFQESVPLNRHLAFLVRLIEIASNAPSLPYGERLKAASLAVTAVQMARNQAFATNGTADRIDVALSKTFEIHKTFSLYPAIAAVIEEGGLDQQNVVAKILSTMQPHEMDLLRRLDERGGTATISGNQDHRRFDGLEERQLIVRRAVNLDTIEYELTEQGRDLLGQNPLP